ncbi:hypothetical protein M408DRAFT_334136 [Serendipita vermifera MAFF 305830]|uniref:F-box domain-containing protein n=1 Tax=Serendipita vermifera MAFF 305830 TaxID=933852 RepID=A0A0C3AJ52_SERVB|nr:hypothetical protein M408DRAFT_334136 [Serendipita vermifera MAFF 305830]
MLINGLPVEILGIIFELFVPSPDCWIDPTTYLVLLCSVCRLWRQVALQNPLLWTALHLPMSEAAFQWTECILPRSRSAPLHIFVVPKYHEPKSPAGTTIKEWSSRFLKLIEGHSQRWRTVEVDVPEAAIDLTPIWKGQAPMLQKLVIDTLPLSRDSRNTAPVLPANNHLALLDLSGFPVRWDQWNCTSITNLELGFFTAREPGPNPIELCNILSLLSTQLRELSILGKWQPISDHVSNSTPILLESLESFTTSRWEWPVQEVLLNCSFPVLEHFDTKLPLGNLSIRLLSRLSMEPALLQSVKRLSVKDIEDELEVSMEEIQLVFPQASHVQFGYGIDLEILDHSSSCFLSNWACMDQLDIYEASLAEIRQILAKRYEKYPTPLLELKLNRALGPIHRADYEWVISRVKCLTIEQVVITCNGISESLPFENIYIIPQGVV